MRNFLILFTICISITCKAQSDIFQSVDRLNSTYYEFDPKIYKTIESIFYPNGMGKQKPDTSIFFKEDKVDLFLADIIEEKFIDENTRETKHLNQLGKLLYTVIEKFDQNGMLLEKKDIYGSSSSLNTTNTFSYNQLQRIEEIQKNGELVTEISYDNKGNIQSLMMNLGFSKSVISSERLDSNKLKYQFNILMDDITMQHLNNPKNDYFIVENLSKERRKISQFVWNSETRSFFVSIEQSVDKNGKVIDFKIYNADGSLQKDFQYNYSENGVILSIEEQVKKVSYPFTYDDKERVVIEHNFDHTCHYEYNDKDDIISKIETTLGYDFITKVVMYNHIYK